MPKRSADTGKNSNWTEINMINPFSEINWKPGKTELRKFGKTVLIGLLIIAALFLLMNLFKFRQPLPKATFSPLILIGAGLTIFLLSYFARPLAMPIYYIWFIAGASIGIVVSNVLLAAFYYLIFTPIALLLKSRGRDILKIRKNPLQESYWIRIESRKDQRRYFKQY